jgi:hypothetical protein
LDALRDPEQDLELAGPVVWHGRGHEGFRIRVCRAPGGTGRTPAAVRPDDDAAPANR